MDLPEGMNPQAMKATMDQHAADRGAHIIMHLLAGPEHWETMPTCKLSERAARQAKVLLEVIRERGMAEAAPQSFLASQGYLAHVAIDSLIAELEMWALENGRDDILKTPLQLVNDALPEDERLPE